ncbi:Na+/H+ antiporter NhaC family protein [Emergencia sp.]|uniref:Na+/H+ antiporter NhaC family protein n=1 Tax=Emergencia sp. TaxID=1926557 RepID=UPI003AF154F1
MDYGLLACIPMIILIVGALITKRIAEMLVLSSIIAAILVYKEDFFTGYIEWMYGVLSTHSYQFVLIVLMGFGGMIKLLQHSGAIIGFGNLMTKGVKGPKRTLMTAWIMSFLIFVDNYLSTLTISFSMREVSDRYKIPREHLAFQISTMACCLCALIPFSSWTAYTVGLISQHGLSFSNYIAAIPYMFYPFIMVIICILLGTGIMPKLGTLKESYQRVAAGGPVVITEKSGTSMVEMEMPEEGKTTSPLNIIVPIVTFIAVSLYFDNDLTCGIFAAIGVQAVLYLAQKIMTLTEFVNHIFDGAKSMTNLAIIICFAYILSSANETLGFLQFFIGGISSMVSPKLLLALIFVVVGFSVFATAGYWSIQVIAIPIFIPLAISMGVNPSLAIAAVMSGIVFGCNICFYVDTVFMTSAGTGVSNLRQIKVTAPYAIAGAILTAVGYLIVGIFVI